MVTEGTALSPREVEVLSLLAGGLSHKQIALRLGITAGTVKNHALIVYLKLGAANAANAIHLAHERGLLRTA